MKIKALHKRVIAWTMAAVLASMPLGSFSMENPVLAAVSSNKIEFKEKIWENEYTYTNNTTVVAGYGVDTRTLMPDYGAEGNGWQYTNPPFSFYHSGAAGDGTSPNLTGDAGTRQITVSNTLQPIGGNSDWLQYTINPNLTVNVSKGYGSFIYPRVVDSNVQMTTVAVETTSSSPLSVTSNSSITFRTVEGQVEANGAQSLSFEKVSAATGTWNPLFLGATVLAQNVKANSFEVVIRSSMPGQDQKYMTLTVKSPMAQVPKGATFTLNYTFDTLNEMTLTAVSPDRAVQDVKTDMMSYPTSESATGKKLPYIKFNNAGDTLNAVTGQFNLLNEFYKYNAPMKIDWTLENPADADYVVIKQQPGNQQIIAQVKNNVSEQDRIVNLVATIGYKKGAATTVSTTHTIPITILGSGSRPKVEILTAHNGIYKNGAQEIIDKTITQFPTQMEVYDGSVAHVAKESDQRSWPPFKVQTNMKFGYSQGRATSAKISASGVGQLELLQGGAPNGTLISSTGITIANNATGSVEQLTSAAFVAKKAGSVVLKIEYFNAAGLISPAYIYNIEVLDHSPSGDATLKSLDMTGIVDPLATDEQKEMFNQLYIPGGAISYGFDPKTATYELTVPDVVAQITLKPVYNVLSVYEDVDQDVVITTIPVKDSGNNTVPPGQTSRPISLVKDGMTTVTVRAKAEDGSFQSYTIKITRSSQSVDSSLKDIQLTRLDAVKTPVELTPKFNVGVLHYAATVPYSVDSINVKAIASSSWGARPTITSDGPQRNLIARIFENSSNRDILLTYDATDPENIKNVTTVTVEVKAENPDVPPSFYVIRITRNNPDDNRELKDMKIFRDREAVEVKLDGKGFDKNQRMLYATVPYSTSTLRLDLLPDSDLAQQVRVEASAGGNKNQTLKYVGKGKPLTFHFTGLAQSSKPDPALNTIVYKIWVMAESGKETEPPYQLTISRAPADTDTRLSSLTVVDDADNKPVSTFSFIPTKRDYSFSVSYNTEAVIVTPVAKSKLSKVFVNGKQISENMPSQTIKLAAGGVTKITILVVPESGTAGQEAYTLSITRTAPAKEARLSALVVNGGEDQKPTPFVPATTSYSWSIPDGTKNFTVTATPVDPLASITINGESAPNGAASNPIVSTQASSTIQIVVTAQDGVTKKTYTIKITDYNFIKKSDNADLASLKTDYGQLAPGFNPGVLEYEVYVKPNAMKLGVIPRPANSKAKMEVKAGSLVLTKFDDTYTSSLLEDETVFTIKVTSEDGKQEKIYKLNIYRNDEEKEGIFSPITGEMVDFESADPIIIDISTYPVVDAEVFNTLKTEYPDKTILFKGNDYTFQLKGSDLDTLVPNTVSYDLSFSFTTPDERVIRDVLNDLGSGNDRLDPVYVYFDHHGTLPGPMLLTVSLGKEYSNDTLYWNYYNPERSRVDYYGYVKTNAKGTFSVPIDHFSTYMITKDKIRGAENKSGLDYSSMPWMEEIGIEKPTDKYNPNTGAKAGGGK